MQIRIGLDFRYYSKKNHSKERQKELLALDYRPIALLDVCYNILVRLILNRISDQANEHIPIEQAGFRKNRSHRNQVSHSLLTSTVASRDVKKTPWYLSTYHGVEKRNGLEDISLRKIGKFTKHACQQKPTGSPKQASKS